MIKELDNGICYITDYECKKIMKNKINEIIKKINEVKKC
jgi:hypothetical protein